MRTSRFPAAAAVLAAATIVVAGSTRLAPEFEMPDMSPESQAKMMGEYMALMAPSEQHEMLSYFVGDWEASSRMWMGGEGGEAPAIEDSGKASYEMAFDGRFLRQRYEGTMMGMPYTGEAMLGFDNYAGFYQGTWVSTMSTTMTYMTGHAHQDGKGMTLYATMDEPGLKMRNKMVEYRTRIIDEDTFVFEIHDLHIGGDNTKVMAITYERQG
jgi:hypothetical protein